jgi:spore coat polysaccharide biosynthesis protein SpsF
MNKKKFRTNINKNHNLQIIIEARSTSKRLKRKHLFKFNNISLIRVLIKKLKKIQNINGIILATTTNREDEDLIKEAKKEKINIFRGEEHNVLERVIGACEKYNLDSFCRVTGDSPLIDINYLQLLIDNYLRNLELDYISNSIYMPKGQGAAIIKVKALKKARKFLKKDQKYKEFITLHILENLGKFKKMFLYHGNKISNFKTSSVLDTRNDLNFIKKISNKFDLQKVTIENIMSIKRN